MLYDSLVGDVDATRRVLAASERAGAVDAAVRYPAMRCRRQPAAAAVDDGTWSCGPDSATAAAATGGGSEPAKLASGRSVLQPTDLL
mmetsp:Transcript_65423/g.179514  ORF Transcript_65423/g.179514 Transcript_65423/m.179514 type:complete len:87 (+) Transcript_65423:681-941(+)